MIKVSIFLIIIMSLVFQIAYAGEETKKELCKENGGKWEDGACDFKTDDEDKADQFLEDVEKIEEFEEEKADLEDALCDDQEDSEKFDVCKYDVIIYSS